MLIMIANRSVAASDRGNVPCPSSTGFIVAIAKLKAGSSKVVLPTVTVRSCSASRNALCDFSGMRLISSSRITSACAIGPNSVISSPVAGLIIWKPTTSVGCRSARPCRRTNFALLIAARITPKNVLPTPGTPRSRRLPALTCRCSFLSYEVGISDIRTTVASAFAVSSPTSAFLPSAMIASWKPMACSRSGCIKLGVVSYLIEYRFNEQGAPERRGGRRADRRRRDHYDGRLRPVRDSREPHRRAARARRPRPHRGQQQRRRRRFRDRRAAEGAPGPQDDRDLRRREQGVRTAVSHRRARGRARPAGHVRGADPC